MMPENDWLGVDFLLLAMETLMPWAFVGIFIWTITKYYRKQ